MGGGMSRPDLAHVPGRQAVQSLENATDQWPQVSHAIRPRVDDHNANAESTQILLVLKASIHGQQGIETLVGPP